MQSSLQKFVEGRIDFEGQKTAEKITKVTLIGSTAVSFVVGFVAQSLLLTFSVLGLSTLMLVVLVVPQWPVYNQHPVKWLPVHEKKKQ